jgi:predicted TIM-barrel fold metal-dependent hydrolase
VQRLGTFVFIHPSLSCDGSCFSPQGFEAYDLYRTLGREYDLLSAIIRLVCGGVLDDFPELKIVIGHVGGAISPLLGRIRGYQDKAALGIADDPVHGRTAQREFDYYLTRLYFDTGGHFGDITAIQAALLNIPSSQIMFGTDYPQEIRHEATVARFLADLRALDLSAEAITGILGENARNALFAD